MKNQFNSPSKSVIVLDTSAFLAGFDPFSLPQEQYTVPKVEEEIKKNSMAKVRFEMALESGKIRIKAPSDESLASAHAAAGKVGDAHKLSETDMQVLALALDLKAVGCTPQIITDDYSIQNVARQLDMEFLALATFGIKRLLEWIRYCPACHRKYPANYQGKECQVCGTELKRKPQRTKKTSNKK